MSIYNIENLIILLWYCYLFWWRYDIIVWWWWFIYCWYCYLVLLAIWWWLLLPQYPIYLLLHWVIIVYLLIIIWWRDEKNRWRFAITIIGIVFVKIIINLFIDWKVNLLVLWKWYCSGNGINYWAWYWWNTHRKLLIILALCTICFNGKVFIWSCEETLLSINYYYCVYNNEVLWRGGVVLNYCYYGIINGNWSSNSGIGGDCELRKLLWWYYLMRGSGIIIIIDIE